MATLLLAAAAFGYLTLAHRVDQPSVSFSVARSVDAAHTGAGLVADCEHSRGADWTCSLEDVNGEHGGIVYMLQARGDCWTARLAANFSGFRLPVHTRGCVGVLDQLRIGDHLDAGAAPHGFY